MLHRRFGKTGLSMPVLSFGCMRSMHSWRDTSVAEIPEESNKKFEAIVMRALAHGINHLETAHGYGSSESQLGSILQKIPRESYILQTKVSPSEDPDIFLKKVAQSMKRLQVARLDLLALHGINDHRSLWYCCRKDGCLAAARRLQDQGIVDHVGFSGHGPCDVIVSALEHDENGGFDFFNVHWYYIFDANRRAIECAKDRDIGTFIISPTDKGGYLHTPVAKMVKLCAPLSPMLFNDLYCLQQEGVCTISIGASLPDHFDEHLKVLPYLESEDRETISRIDQELGRAMLDVANSERPDFLWAKLPPWEQVPGNINLRLILWLHNLFKAWGLEQYARDRYAMLNTGSAWIPGNNGSRVMDMDFSDLDTIENLQPEDIKQLVADAHNQLWQSTL